MLLRETREFAVLAERIRSMVNGGSFDYFPSPGNWGDALINGATRQFFEYFKLPYMPLLRDASPESKAARSSAYAVVGGGGGWCKNWNSTVDFVQRMSMVYDHVLVLPTTFESGFPLEGSNVTYFSRDSVNFPENAVFCHDMAFFGDFFSDCSDDDVSMPYPLYAFRIDREQADEAIAVSRNLDLSLLGISYSNTTPLASVVSRFPEIYTDRLHLAILGAMAGSEVKLFPGNYFKNRGVFESSIRDWFPSVRWCEWDALTA